MQHLAQLGLGADEGVAVAGLEGDDHPPRALAKARVGADVDLGVGLLGAVQAGGAATMCVREYDFQVPFGVVEMEDQQIKTITEKPVQQFFVNAGIYVLNPDLIDLIPENDYFDMTTLFDHLVERGQKASVFPINEYWLDIGRMDDLDLARLDYNDVFGS